MRAMGILIIMIYGSGFSIAVLYEEWMYFLEECFVAWLLFGWIVPFFRATDWPLSLYQAPMS